MKNRARNNEAEQSAITPQEAQWRASVYSPEKLRRRFRGLYVLLAIWSALTLAWIIAVCLYPEELGWGTVLVLLAGYINVFVSIVNTRRLMAGKKPW